MSRAETKFEIIFDNLKTKLNLTKKQTEKLFNQILINPNLSEDIIEILKIIHDS